MTRKKWVLWGTLVLALNLAGSVGARVGTADPRDLQRLIDDARAAYGIPGMSVAIARGSEIIWQGVSGYSDVENRLLVTPQTVFRIGSVSKPITATAIMTLVDAGKIELDVPIQKYLPEYNADKARRITVRHLLNHASGIRHYRYELGEKENQHHFHSQREALGLYNVDQDPLAFEPGHGHLYSTYGYNLLGAIIESVTGGSYGDYVKQHIFLPADMLQTRLDEDRALIAMRARHYRRNAKGELSNAPYVDSSFKWSAGGIVSTASDLLRLHISLEQGRLLSRASKTLSEMTTILPNGKDAEYGLGWRVSRDKLGRKWVGHGGTATGGTSSFVRSPDQHLAVVILCNLEKVKELRQLALQLVEGYL